MLGEVPQLDGRVHHFSARSTFHLDEDPVLSHLRIGGHLVGGGDDAEGDGVLVEKASPLFQWALGEPFLEDLRELPRVGTTIVDGLEARICRELWALDGGTELGVFRGFFHEHEEEGTPVGGSIVIHHGIGGTGLTRRHVGRSAGQGRLHQNAVGPGSVGHEGGRDLRALAGSLARIEGQRNPGEYRHGTGMISHGRSRQRQLGAPRPHGIHQARARPPGGGVVAGLLGLRADLSVTGSVCVDQPRILRGQFFVGDAEILEDRGVIVGDEDVRVPHDVEKHTPALVAFQVDDDALLVATVEEPAVVLFAFG